MIEPFGPEYNVTSAGLGKHRRLARNGLAAMSRAERVAYADAVERAILAAQRREALRACEPERRPNCASGSWDEFPGDAIRRQQRAALAACASRQRRARSDVEWRTMYEAAMDDKARRIADELWEEAA